MKFFVSIEIGTEEVLLLTLEVTLAMHKYAFAQFQP